MRVKGFLNARHPAWRFAGWGTLAGVVAVSGLFVVLGPRPLAPKAPRDLFQGSQGRFGTITEQLGEGRIFVLDYDTIQGDQDNLELHAVKGRLSEPEAHWLMISPAGRRAGGTWTLMAPLDVEARNAPGGSVQGHGSIPGSGPALLWEKGVWRGLQPLVWEDVTGQGRGRWHMPAGWHRELDGKFFADQGPVLWEATEPGAVRRMQAQRLWTSLGFREGHLDQVEAELDEGRIWAGGADMGAGTIRWSPPVRFERKDGWEGSAESGRAPLPEKGQPLSRVELAGFKAQRAVKGGRERLQAEGSRWTPAGLRLEGDVQWEQPQDDQPLVLRAPRVLIREGIGPDLPEELPVGEAWAEGHPVLSWGERSLSSPRMEARHRQRTWRILAPVYGRGEQGTFSAGTGQGSPKRWEFQGPVKATVVNGGNLRGDRLLWEADTWTVTGNPATWSDFRERLSGPRIVRKGQSVAFPEGISGALAALDGDFRIRADRAEYAANEIRLLGRVECQGRGWRLQADRISVTLGPGNIARKVAAKGAVTLRGRMGEGWGESLELEPDPVAPKARWDGRVRGLAEIEGKP